MSKTERKATLAVMAEAKETLEMARFVRFTDGRAERARIVIDECEKALAR